MAEKIKIPEIRFKGFDEEWEKRKMEELAVFFKGQGYSKNQLVEIGTPIILYGRLYTKYQTSISEVDTFALENDKSIYSTGNEVIVPASGETAEDIARASAVTKPGVLLGGDLNIIYPNHEISSIFLALTISNGKPQKELSKRAQGKSVVHLRNTDLKETIILYPGKEEQSQIGTLFSHLDHLITLRQRKYNKLVTIKKAMLEKMFPQNGARVPEIRFKGFTEKWEERKLEEMTNYKNGKGHEEKQTSSGKYELINLNSISIDGGLKKSGKFIDETSSTLNKNDIVMVLSDVGHGDLLGRVALIPEDNKYVLNQRVALLRPNQSIIPVFLFYSINAHQGYFKSQGAGMSQLNISKSSVEDFTSYIPTLKEEQSKIGNYFKNLDHLITLQKSELEKLKNIKKACLEKMFV